MATETHDNKIRDKKQAQEATKRHETAQHGPKRTTNSNKYTQNKHIERNKK